MEEELKMIFDNTKSENDKSITHLATELEKIRAGRATPSMLDTVQVEAYGVVSPLSQLGNVNTMDAKTLVIQPWDKGLCEAICKGIMNANLGLNPQNNGGSIIINIPMLTEDRRKDLVKKVKAEGEHARVSIRNNRKEANDLAKQLKSDGIPEDRIKYLETEIQKLTDAAGTKIETLVTKKEADIMTI